METVQIACPALNTYSAILDTRSLDPADLLVKLSKELGPNDVVTVYGTQDSTATSSSVNLTLLGSLSGNNGNYSNGFAVSGWAFLFFFRSSGTSAGGYVIASGNQNGTGSMVAPPSVSLPALNAFSALLSLAVFASGSTLVGLSANQTSRDTFNVYGTNDATAGTSNGVSGGQLLGTIQGGDGTAPGTVLNAGGFAYVFFQRTGGSTSGNAFAWGTSVTAAGGGGGGGGASMPSALNKSMAAQTTTADGQLACSTPIAAAPVGFVGVNVNGVSYDPGNGVTTGCPCYFSNGSGTVAYAQGSIPAGALLWWNGSVAGFQLFGGTPPPPVDLIDFVYNIA